MALRFSFDVSFLRSLRALDWPRDERFEDELAPPAPRGLLEAARLKLDAASFLLSLALLFGMLRSEGGLLPSWGVLPAWLLMQCGAWQQNERAQSTRTPRAEQACRLRPDGVAGAKTSRLAVEVNSSQLILKLLERDL